MTGDEKVHATTLVNTLGIGFINFPFELRSTIRSSTTTLELLWRSVIRDF